MTTKRKDKQKGVFPLFFLIPIVLIAVGYIGVKAGVFKFLAAPSSDQWQKEPPSAKTPTPTSPSRGGTPQNGPFNYQPPAEAAKAGVPAFTILPPSGWLKYNTSGGELARFESQEIDTEKVAGGEVTTNAVISVKAAPGYTSLNDFISQYKVSGSKAKDYRLLGASARKVAATDGYQMEFTYKKSVGTAEITVREFNLLTFKNGFSFLIKGFTSNSSWQNHAGQIQSALDSFRFN